MITLKIERILLGRNAAEVSIACERDGVGVRRTTILPLYVLPDRVRNGHEYNVVFTLKEST